MLSSTLSQDGSPLFGDTNSPKIEWFVPKTGYIAILPPKTRFYRKIKKKMVGQKEGQVEA